MTEQGSLFTIYTLTPLHAGAGDSAGAIDLPVEREKHTEYPCVYASGIKGSLREYFRRSPTLKLKTEDIFGKEGTEGASGQVVFTDAKILFFPVRSSAGVFKWVTCPFVIRRFYRDLRFITSTRSTTDISAITVSGYEGLSYLHNITPDLTLILEDFPIAIKKVADTEPWKTFLQDIKTLTASHIDDTELTERLVVVSDDVFNALVTTATQVIARNVLNDKTKKSENLWYEEVVPPDAIFYTVMLPTFRNATAATMIKDLSDNIAEKILQIGGNETIGYGQVALSKNCAESYLAEELTKISDKEEPHGTEVKK